MRAAHDGLEEMHKIQIYEEGFRKSRAVFGAFFPCICTNIESWNLLKSMNLQICMENMEQSLCPFLAFSKNTC